MRPTGQLETVHTTTMSGTINRPERFELFELADGEEKCEFRSAMHFLLHCFIVSWSVCFREACNNALEISKFKFVFDNYSIALSRRLTYTKDSKMPDAATCCIKKEDHTLGNLLRMYAYLC